MNLTEDQKEDISRRVRKIYDDAKAGKNIDKGLLHFHKAINKITGRAVDDYRPNMSLLDLAVVRNVFQQQGREQDLVLVVIGQRFYVKSWKYIFEILITYPVSYIRLTDIGARCSNAQDSQKRAGLQALARALNNLLDKTPKTKTITTAMIAREMEECGWCGESSPREYLRRYGVNNKPITRHYDVTCKEPVKQRLPRSIDTLRIIKQHGVIMVPPNELKNGYWILNRAPTTKPNKKTIERIQYILDLKRTSSE